MNDHKESTMSQDTITPRALTREGFAPASPYKENIR